jgi:alpha-beta hydrolase superfamily lysophospholipase
MVNADINLTPTATLFEVDSGSVASRNGAGGSFGKITGRTWGSPSECQAAILLIHGLGAHSGWFEPLARRLKVRNLFVLAYDLVGFGKRIKQHYRSPEQWLTDLTAVYGYLKKLTGDKPIYLIGNSMGSIVALQACPLLKPSGLALLSPGFEGHAQTFPLSFRLKTIVQALLNPDKEMQLPYNRL